MISSAKKTAAKTVLVSGHFNVIHPGHLRLLKFAKECGTRLVVAVESDRVAGSAAYVPELLRLEGVLSHSMVDEALIFDEPIADVIARLRPAIVVKGKEHQGRLNPELLALSLHGGKLLFSSGEAVFSSMDLLRREFLDRQHSTLSLPVDFMTRHGVTRERLLDLVHHFESLRVLVVGDMIVDEYITCEPLGMSQEDPTIVVTPVDSTRFVGGAGIVSAHASGLGAKATFLSVVGVDDSADFCRSNLASFGVSAILLDDPTRPTTLKQRFRSGGKSLLRVSRLHQGAISQELQGDLIAAFRSALESVDVVVFSDFNYGVLPQALVHEMVAASKRDGLLLTADSQSSSQLGDISRFVGMDLITPTEREARLSIRNSEDGLVILAERLRAKCMAKNVFLKLGAEGLLVHASQPDGGEFFTDQVPALNRNPRDVAGAGDSMLISASLALAGGATVWEAACLGSLAAALQVGRVGNTPLEKADLLRELTA